MSYTDDGIAADELRRVHKRSTDRINAIADALNELTFIAEANGDNPHFKRAVQILRSEELAR